MGIRLGLIWLGLKVWIRCVLECGLFKVLCIVVLCCDSDVWMIVLVFFVVFGVLCCCVINVLCLICFLR